MDNPTYNPTAQQTGYSLLRRSYRMRDSILELIERGAKLRHVSRSKMLNDVCEAGMRYITTGDTLPLTELRMDLQQLQKGKF
jgi:hypothetical protein